MESILSEAADKQNPNGHHVCPNCRADALDATTRLTASGTLHTDCLCPSGHLWAVHWMAA